MDKLLKTALISLIFNIIYGVYHIILGAITKSWWLLTVGVYYCILSAMRFVIIYTKKRVHILSRFTGFMLIALSVLLIGTVIFAVIRDRGQKFHIIAMIAIATYSFTKITLAIIKIIKSRHSHSAKTVALRSVSLADAFVSIFSMQRSMLVTFEGMTDAEIRLMNTLTGSGVCIIVLLLGLNLIIDKNVLFKNLRLTESKKN